MGERPAVPVPALAAGESFLAVAQVQDLVAAPGFAFALPDEDEARIGRLVHDRDRRSRRAAWRLARFCLGAVLGMAPAEVALRRDRRGRPHLEEEAGLDFNVSHAGSSVAVGVMRGGRIGVDVEHQRPLALWQDLIGEFLDAADAVAWARLSADGRADAALSAWCRKESVLKATGEGLAADPRAVSLPLGPQAAVIGRAGRSFTVATLHAAVLAPDAALAVAVEGVHLPRLLALAGGTGWSLSGARPAAGP